MCRIHHIANKRLGWSSYLSQRLYIDVSVNKLSSRWLALRIPKTGVWKVKLSAKSNWHDKPQNITRISRKPRFWVKTKTTLIVISKRYPPHQLEIFRPVCSLSSARQRGSAFQDDFCGLILQWSNVETAPELLCSAASRGKVQSGTARLLVGR